MQRAITAELVGLVCWEKKPTKNWELSFNKTIVEVHAYNAITRYHLVFKFQKEHIIKHQQIIVSRKSPNIIYIHHL